jgi:NAD(P)-dependent dehydrogenase (short-subunit alcohol dehydrogenase family)
MITKRGGRATSHVCDVTEANACAGLAHFAKEQFGHVDALLNVVALPGIIGPITAVNEQGLGSRTHGQPQVSDANVQASGSDNGQRRKHR